jgi:hypothetical protein
MAPRLTLLLLMGVVKGSLFRKRLFHSNSSTYIYMHIYTHTHTDTDRHTHTPSRRRRPRAPFYLA